MKHMIKWLKITAAINIYLSIIMTLVLIVLTIDILVDYSWHRADFLENLTSTSEEIQ